MASRSLNKVWIKAKTATEAKKKAQKINTGFIATKAVVVSEKEYAVTLRKRKRYK